MNPERTRHCYRGGRRYGGLSNASLTPLVPTRRWEGTAVGPESQETTSDHKAEQPSGKGWLMHVKQVIRAGAAALGTAATLGATLALATTQVATAAAPHAGAKTAPKVSVRIIGRTRTLLKAEKVQTRTGWITRGGAPAGKCPATSAQGALNVATHGNWKGTWYASYHEYFITRIFADKETSKKYYWALYVNGKVSSKGACDVKLRTGDRLTFKVTKS